MKNDLAVLSHQKIVICLMRLAHHWYHTHIRIKSTAIIAPDIVQMFIQYKNAHLRLQAFAEIHEDNSILAFHLQSAKG